MDRSAAAEISVAISLPSARVAETVFKSIRPETRQTSGFRSRTIVGRRGRVLEISIKAEDIVALRAATNSFLRFAAVAVNAVNVVAPFYIPDRSDLFRKLAV